MNSRQKGARGEREAAAAWVETVGGEARRGQQFSGGAESPDVVSSYENIHLEVKRVERGNPYQWMDQAIRDAGPKLPLVLHKRNRRDWLVVVRLCDVPRLAKEIGGEAAAVGNRAVSDPVPGAGVSATEQQDGRPSGVFYL